MKRLLPIAIVLLLTIGGPANAYVCPNGPPSPWPQPTASCNWEPQADSSHPNVTTCNNANPSWDTVYFYTDTNYGGLCASVSASVFVNGVYGLNGDYMFTMLNGFWEGVPQVHIRSIKLGGSRRFSGVWTALWITEGPDATANPDPFYHCAMSNSGTSAVGYPDIEALPCMSGAHIQAFYLMGQP